MTLHHQTTTKRGDIEAALILPREVPQASSNHAASTQTNSSTIFAMNPMAFIPQCRCLLSIFYQHLSAQTYLWMIPWEDYVQPQFILIFQGLPWHRAILLKASDGTL